MSFTTEDTEITENSGCATLYYKRSPFVFPARIPGSACIETPTINQQTSARLDRGKPPLPPLPSHRPSIRRAKGRCEGDGGGARQYCFAKKQSVSFVLDHPSRSRRCHPSSRTTSRSPVRRRHRVGLAPWWTVPMAMTERGVPRLFEFEAEGIEERKDALSE